MEIGNLYKKYTVKVGDYEHIVVASLFRVIDGILHFFDAEENHLIVIRDWSFFRVESLEEEEVVPEQQTV